MEGKRILSVSSTLPGLRVDGCRSARSGQLPCQRCLVVKLQMSTCLCVSRGASSSQLASVATSHVAQTVFGAAEDVRKVEELIVRSHVSQLRKHDHGSQFCSVAHQMLQPKPLQDQVPVYMNSSNGARDLTRFVCQDDTRRCSVAAACIIVWEERLRRYVDSS